jgi:hypothetical protein
MFYKNDRKVKVYNIKEYPSINQIKKSIKVNPMAALLGASKHAGRFLCIYIKMYIAL